MPITQSLEFTWKWRSGHICLLTFNETEERGKKYIKPIPARPKLSTFRHWNGQLNDILSWRVGDGAISSRDGVSVVYILSWQLVPNISGQDDPRYAFIFFSVYIPCYFFFFLVFREIKKNMMRYMGIPIMHTMWLRIHLEPRHNRTFLELAITFRNVSIDRVAVECWAA